MTTSKQKCVLAPLLFLGMYLSSAEAFDPTGRTRPHVKDMEYTGSIDEYYNSGHHHGHHEHHGSAGYTHHEGSPYDFIFASVDPQDVPSISDYLPVGGSYITRWESCTDSAQCQAPGTFCRRGDQRCMSDKDCALVNSIPGAAQRDCSRLPATMRPPPVDLNSPVQMEPWFTQKRGESCHNSDQCADVSTACRLGDRRCLTDEECVALHGLPKVMPEDNGESLFDVYGSSKGSQGYTESTDNYDFTPQPNDPFTAPSGPKMYPLVHSWPCLAIPRLQPLANRGEICAVSDQCIDPDTHCRVGDRRCLMDADCAAPFEPFEERRSNESERIASSAGTDCTRIPRVSNLVNRWGGCLDSDQCVDPNTFCRVGDMRCLTDEDCQWLNDMDGGDRDCMRMPRTVDVHDKVLEKYLRLALLQKLRHLTSGTTASSYTADQAGADVQGVQYMKDTDLGEQSQEGEHSDWIDGQREQSDSDRSREGVQTAQEVDEKFLVEESIMQQQDASTVHLIDIHVADDMGNADAQAPEAGAGEVAALIESDEVAEAGGSANDMADMVDTSAQAVESGAEDNSIYESDGVNSSYDSDGAANSGEAQAGGQTPPEAKAPTLSVKWQEPLQPDSPRDRLELSDGFIPVPPVNPGKDGVRRPVWGDVNVHAPSSKRRQQKVGYNIHENVPPLVPM